MEVQDGAVLGRNHDDTAAEFQGTLSKWTNYILGWKSRFFVLKQGHLLYYKSQEDVQFGCRGAINLSSARLLPHKLDECRFDLHFCDLFWYLRADSGEERKKWIDVLSTYTIIENTDAPFDSFHSKHRSDVSEKIKEIGTYKELMLNQMAQFLNSISAHCEALKSVQNCKNDIERHNGEHSLDGLLKQILAYPVDMKAEIMTFKATADILLTSITQCVGIMNDRERLWLMTQEGESDCGVFVNMKDFYNAGPELIEGENCILRDEEFYDAVESELERIEEEAELRKRLEDTSVDDSTDSGRKSQHPLKDEIERVTKEQVELTCSAMTNDWSLLVEGENMKMFTRDMEVNGVVIDPLKAVCTVKGVTGREISHYFYHPQYRKDWEMTLEQMTVVEKIGDDTMVFHQVYKRIWPAAQRDLLFWSHLWHQETPGNPDVWAVINKSIDLPQIPANDGRYVRVTLSLCLYCVTEMKLTSEKISRDDITCHLTYCSTVNPGGWVPASALRALSRKEYPKFLNKFTSYVVQQTKDKEILL